MKYLPDYIKNIVTAISSQPRPVYFMFGNWQELCIDLADKAKSKTYADARYPLILMHNDYSENINTKNGKVEVDELNIYIICQTEPNLSTQQRWDTNYKQTLLPIYEDFLTQMKFGSTFDKNLYKLEHEKKDLYKLYVGDKQNRLPDHLDAIAISFKNLIYNLKTCKNGI